MATNSLYEINAIAAVERPLQVWGPVAKQHAANAAFADYLAEAGVTVDAVLGLRHQASLCYNGDYNPLSVCGFAASGEHRRWVVFCAQRYLPYL